MIKAEKIVEILEAQLTRLRKLEGEDLAGFAIIVPPEGDPIDLLVMESPTDTKSFFMRLRDRMVGSAEQNQYGGVNVPGMPRR